MIEIRVIVKVRFSVSLNVNSIDYVDINCNECRVCQHTPHTQTDNTCTTYTHTIHSTRTHVHNNTPIHTHTHTHTYITQPACIPTFGYRPSISGLPCNTTYSNIATVRQASLTNKSILTKTPVNWQAYPLLMTTYQHLELRCQKTCKILIKMTKIHKYTSP